MVDLRTKIAGKSLRPVKILVIGNYPPPMCGWAMQTYLVTAELRGRGQVCDVLKINENRMVRSPDYVDVQDAWDYLAKIVRFALCGYRLNVHVNAMSKKGYLLALVAAMIGRLTFRPVVLTFHGGPPQDYFPRPDSWRYHQAFHLLFRSARRIACDSLEIKQAMESYGIKPQKIAYIASFSPRYLTFTPTHLPMEVEEFLSERRPVFLSYLSFRPEYRLDVLREGMKRFQERYPAAGFIWVGFLDRELSGARAFVRSWAEKDRRSLLLLGNLAHDDFLTLLTRCSAYLRSPACDGVCASVLEAVALGVPVVASENGRRPAGVITYRDRDAADMCAKMLYVIENYSEVRAYAARFVNHEDAQDSIACMADWLTQDPLGD